jgi:hypothetical protein
MAYALFVVVTTFGLVRSGLVSQACIVNDRCPVSQYGWLVAVGAGWIAGSVVLIILGWRGRLFGCRIRRNAAEERTGVDPT